MIFVVGGQGFLGSAFVRRCQARGLACVAITRQNYGEFVGQECAVLVNANGNSRKYIARADPLWDFDASVRSVRASLREFRAGLYVYLSSVDVYPDSSAPEMTREDQDLDVARQTPYGFHKYLAELCVRQAAPKWLIVRGGGFVGPDLTKNAIYDILNGGPLWLDPGSELQYLHADDAADMVLELARQEITNEVFNLSAWGVVRLQEVVELVGREVAVRPGSPRMRCEVTLEKLSRYVPVPETGPTVARFVQEALERTRR